MLKKIKNLIRYLRSEEYRDKKKLIKWFSKKFNKRESLVGYSDIILSKYKIRPLWIEQNLLKGKFTDNTDVPIVLNYECTYNLKRFSSEDLIKIKEYLKEKFCLND